MEKGTIMTSRKIGEQDEVSEEGKRIEGSNSS
jgi:hypothetical protein